MSRDLHTVLVANRGEIAVRVIRALRETGRRAVAVYSEADVDALHVQLADEAILIGPPPSAQSYLRVDAIVDAARRTGAVAIHPGYGFLSEREHAARAVEDAGLTWIGPRPDTTAQVGDKVVARKIAKQAGVPVIPGSDGPVSAAEALVLGPKLGFPLMLKAQGGGGGKGIRLVKSPEGLAADLERASAEALSAFGEAGVYVEKCITRARHVEVQILGDGRGEAVHLGERECSLQRRQQKVLEESPSLAVSEELRARMGAAAVALARAVKYRGAGTCEFLLDDQGRFYFLEVNARLQVEHPVTEMVTGFDLVRAQLEVAERERLPFGQGDWQPRGHALELRVNAEDPFRGWAPSVGTVRGLELPGGPFVRVDTSLQEGMTVTPYYDSLLAKLIVWGRDRTEAVERLTAASRAFKLGGLRTTLPLVPLLAQDEDFRAARFHTGWLDPWVEARREPAALTEEELHAVAVAAALAAHRARSPGPRAPEEGGGGGPSPWVMLGRRERLGG